MVLFYIFLFLISGAFIYFSGSFVIGSLMKIAKFLGWKEFVVAFFLMAFASSLPNLFVGISSALHKIPYLSFGDIVGGNVVDLTLVLALAVLFAKKGIPAGSQTVQTTLNFTAIAAVLPLFLILDKTISRIDGVLLISFFLFYVFWFFSNKERFTKIYDSGKNSRDGFRDFLKDVGKLILGVVFLLAAGEGIVRSASFFAGYFNFPLTLFGILIIGLCNTMPETYFAVVSARVGQTWMILGDLMGAVIVPSTLVLGIVALIYPIEIVDISPFAIARFFLIISTLSFFFFIRTERKFTRKEAVFLLVVYSTFVLIEFLSSKGDVTIR